ncbi:hypothetical protein [Nonomuraea rosea]|uniref:hypothetical protein n=1 Tax=Nonomuraea rosea TaxID=638574 RepID=UPI0031E74C47
MNAKLRGILTCPSWCDAIGRHDDHDHHAHLLLHDEQDGMSLLVWLFQRNDHREWATPTGGRAGYTRVGSPVVTVMWERGELDGMQSVDVDPVEGAALGDVLQTVYGGSGLAAALVEAARLVTVEGAR